MRIKKGDKVKILLGKDRGQSGVVEEVKAKKKQVLVSGLNLFKKHVKPRAEGEKGGIIDKSRPLPLSKVMLICPKCGGAVRVGHQITAGKKARICLKCKAEI